MWIEAMDPLVLATYGLLLLSVITVWVPLRFLWATVFGVSVVMGYVSGVLHGPALAPLVVLFGAATVYTSPRFANASRWASGALAVFIFAVALLLGLNVFPGFQNPVVADAIVISPNAIPFTLRLNFAKIAAGLILLALVYRTVIQNTRETVEALASVWSLVIANIVVVIVLAWVFGFVKWEPKWHPFFIPWALVNVFFVCMAEEAFFRGFIQRGLSVRFRNHRHGATIAIAVSAVLFGVAHFAGGFTYVVLSTVAGAGYALVFQRSGRIEMSILAHFSLNAVHFLLLTYPRAL